jgi:hypothetical protein
MPTWRAAFRKKPNTQKRINIPVSRDPKGSAYGIFEELTKSADEVAALRTNPDRTHHLLAGKGMWVEIALAKTKAVTPTVQPGLADDEIANSSAELRSAHGPPTHDAATGRFPTKPPAPPATKSPVSQAVEESPPTSKLL